MPTRRLLPFAVLPLATMPRAGRTTAVAVPPGSTARNCGDPGGSVIACQALQEILPLAAASRCPLCGGIHRITGGR